MHSYNYTTCIDITIWLILCLNNSADEFFLSYLPHIDWVVIKDGVSIPDAIINETHAVLTSSKSFATPHFHYTLMRLNGWMLLNISFDVNWEGLNDFWSWDVLRQSDSNKRRLPKRLPTELPAISALEANPRTDGRHQMPEKPLNPGSRGGEEVKTMVDPEPSYIYITWLYFYFYGCTLHV